MGKEGRILHLVRPHLPVNIPFWDYMDEDFISYRRLPGRPLRWQMVRRLPEVDQDALAEQMAAFYRSMRRFHARKLQAAEIGNSDALRYGGCVRRLLREGPRDDLSRVFTTTCATRWTRFTSRC